MQYSTFERELFAIYGTIKHFRHFWHFLEGCKFYVVMNHKMLTFVFVSN